MDQQEEQLTEKESLELIATMINTAKNSYHDTGIGAMMWGIIIAVCSLVKLSEIHFGYRLPFDIYLLTLLAIVPQIFITIKEKKERKVKSYDDSYMDYIWLGFGICIFLLIHIINLVFNAWGPVAQEYKTLAGHSSSFQFSEFIAPLFLMLYGLPTFITGAACKFKPMLWGGLFCWLCSVITVYTALRIDLLLTALAAIVAWFIPGLIMEKEYRLYKKEQTLLNV
ncbi:MAG: hypothetical protein ACXWV1_04660 [Chitinophagaceae bacterium]